MCFECVLSVFAFYISPFYFFTRLRFTWFVEKRPLAFGMGWLVSNLILVESFPKKWLTDWVFYLFGYCQRIKRFCVEYRNDWEGSYFRKNFVRSFKSETEFWQKNHKNDTIKMIWAVRWYLLVLTSIGYNFLYHSVVLYYNFLKMITLVVVKIKYKILSSDKNN
jgi:hypothetical protein